MENESGAGAALAITGERFHPEVFGEVRQEHMHRYGWCLDLVAGKDVLDIASGEGFGSALLARRARSVIGIDLSGEAVAHATARYGSGGLSFVRADAAHIPLPDACADVIVSFETIEHVTDQVAVLAEMKRLLRPDGFLVLSSPNIEIYTNRQDHHNPFHTREMTRSEFVALLEAEFPAVEIYGQRLAVASTILGGQATEERTSLLRDEGELTANAGELGSTMYFLAIAAASPDHLPPAGPSILLSSAYDVYWQLRDDLRQAGAQNRALKRQVKELALHSRTSSVLESGLFDEAHYRRVSGETDMPLVQLVAHYLDRGETAGFSPSRDFDPHFYAEANPDVAKSGIGLLLHYLLYGRAEGRKPVGKP